MDHERAAAEITQLQAGSQHGLRGGAVGIHEQGGQVAEVAVTPGRTMCIRPGRIVMAARGTGGHPGSVLLARFAGRVLMKMETMKARGQAAQRGLEYQSIPGLSDRDLPNAGAHPMFVDQVHRDHDIGKNRH